MIEVPRAMMSREALGLASSHPGMHVQLRQSVSTWLVLNKAHMHSEASAALVLPS